MGGGNYSDTVYTSFLSASKSTDGGVFKHTAAIRAGKVETKVHESLDATKLNKAGIIIRESLDSADHPNSVPIAVMFDVTGSMGQVPRILVEKLGDLMGFLIKKNIVPHPHVLFGAIGDATGDKVPFQLGQFEADNTMDSVLASIYLEGNGQSNYHESYELGMYFLARLTNLDSINKRGKKGYAIFIGDEQPFDRVKKADVKRLIGVNEESDIPLEQILSELRNKFEVLWIFPKGSNYWGPRGAEVGIHQRLEELFGQFLVRLEDPALVCETIAKFIAVNEGFDEDYIHGAMKDIGMDDGAINTVSKSLALFTNNNKGLALKATVEGALTLSGPQNGVARL